MAMSKLSKMMGMDIIEMIKIATTRPKYSVFSREGKSPLPNSSVLIASYKFRKTDVALRGCSHVALASGSRHWRFRSNVNAFQVASMLISIMNKNQRIDVMISNSIRTKGPNASNTCTRVQRKMAAID